MKYKKDFSLTKIIKKNFPIMFEAYPGYAVLYIMISVTHGLSYAFNTFITQKFFDTAVNVTNKHENVRNIIIMTCVLGAFTILSEILNGLDNFLSSNFINKLKGNLNGRINKKCSNIEKCSDFSWRHLLKSFFKKLI
jgi:ATP-binding cassette subfamily B protein